MTTTLSNVDALDAEAWNEQVLEFLRSAEHDPENVPSTLSFLADLLRANVLPDAGRSYLADRIDAIARGDDPTKVFGLAHGAGGPNKFNQCIGILLFIERTKLAAIDGGMTKRCAATAANLAATKKFGLGLSTIKSEASKGRARYRSLGLSDEQFAAVLRGSVPRIEGAYSAR